MDSHVRDLRDQFVTRAWSRHLYNGLYFSPECEFVENSIIFSQQNVTGQVNMMAYKGNVRCFQHIMKVPSLILFRYTSLAALATLAISTTSELPRWIPLRDSVRMTLRVLLRLVLYG